MVYDSGRDGVQQPYAQSHQDQAREQNEIYPATDGTEAHLSPRLRQWRRFNDVAYLPNHLDMQPSSLAVIAIAAGLILARANRRSGLRLIAIGFAWLVLAAFLALGNALVLPRE